MAKLKVALLYGGKSSEHEVSIHSAETVLEILEKKYEVVKIFIDKKGLWFLQDKLGPKQDSDKALTPVIAPDHQLVTADGEKLSVEVFFPVLHGANGEDGTIQGFFEVMGIAYVGCGVLASSLGMDKELCKLIASFYGVPIVPYIKLEAHVKYSIKEIKEAVLKLGYPLFIKPVSLGSSIGVSRVDKEEDLEAAVKNAFKYDSAILIEKGIDKAREIFCGVVGYAGEIHTSLCGELLSLNSKFFDYKAKYEDPNGCDMKIPADIGPELQNKMRHATYDIFKVIRGSGMARVDFLLGQDGKFYFSEINTIPGLSSNSLFPNLWQASRKTYADIIDILIHLALKRKMVQDGFSLER